MVGKLGKAVAVLIAVGFVGLGFSMGMTAEQPDIQISGTQITEEGIQVDLINQNPDEPAEIKVSLVDFQDNDREISSETITMNEEETSVLIPFDGELNPNIHAITLEIDNREVDRDNVANLMR
ncbi:hypothetical protein [Methanonatronarchaeum sp. AMET-Sl]|uniref:hypothetical protein n=1 Tax=Methanonatronarchaeum sp. AMET-Sl TaxID=3037654 RepID=UPI00244DDD21|nr:hypothetical protein [Methanonatronarchaeum sp. AMET-Sl]WGI17021.1 hypothetical protein QEN48_05845 [Methanonatronarchaeum sp. AMET-Sl]